MNKRGFLASMIWLILILVSKLAFYQRENLLTSPVILLEQLLVTGLLVACCYAYFKKKRHEHIDSHSNSVLTIGLILGISFVFVSIAIENLTRRTVAFDAITLYDSRAKMMLAGDTFRSMQVYSTYDSAQPSYYWYHPPFTSMIHYFWYIHSFPIPIGSFYTATWIFCSLIVYYFSKTTLGKNGALTVVFISLASTQIVRLSIVEYSNLPFALTLLVQFFASLSYLKKPTHDMALLIALSASLSIWIRAVEPLWAIMYLALAITLTFRRSFFRANIILYASIIVPLLSFFTWSYLIHNIIRVTYKITSEAPTFSELIAGITDGKFLQVISTLFHGWGYPYIVFIITLLLSAFYWKRFNHSVILIFSLLTIILTIGFYIAAMYYASINEIWWFDVARDSVPRATIYLIPIISFVYVVLYTSHKSDSALDKVSETKHPNHMNNNIQL